MSPEPSPSPSPCPDVFSPEDYKRQQEPEGKEDSVGGMRARARMWNRVARRVLHFALGLAETSVEYLGLHRPEWTRAGLLRATQSPGWN